MVYSPAAKQMTWRFDDHAVAIKSQEITISNLPDRDAATIEMEKIIAEINRIWMDRENLTPLHTPRKRLVAMEVYQLLPRTNCKLCGQASCFAFATQITVGGADLQACTPCSRRSNTLPSARLSRRCWPLRRPSYVSG